MYSKSLKDVPTLYEKALDNISSLEEEFKVNLDKEMFITDLLPMYYNIHIDNVNLDRYEGNIGIKYNFETFEGSAQIICKYSLEDECIEVLDWNDVLEEHMENKNKSCEHVFEVEVDPCSMSISKENNTSCSKCDITLAEHEEKLFNEKFGSW